MKLQYGYPKLVAFLEPWWHLLPSGFLLAFKETLQGFTRLSDTIAFERREKLN